MLQWQLRQRYLNSRSPAIYSLPRHGVITLYGYGITVNVDRGHLILKDGIGSDRHEARFPRVGHGLRRLVVIGSDGFVSLAALRWLGQQYLSIRSSDGIEGALRTSTSYADPYGKRQTHLVQYQALKTQQIAADPRN